MSLSLETINQRIKELEAKKKDLEIRDSKTLYKSTKTILGDSFSSNLVIHIISESWKAASTDQKDRWLKAANSFHKKKQHSLQTASTKQEAQKNEA